MEQWPEDYMQYIRNHDPAFDDMAEGDQYIWLTPKKYNAVRSAVLRVAELEENLKGHENQIRRIGQLLGERTRLEEKNRKLVELVELMRAGALNFYEVSKRLEQITKE